MSRRRNLSDEERALWSGLTRSITPLRRSEHATVETKKPISAAPPPAQTPPRTPRPASPPVKSPPLVPLGRRMKQRVARGRDPIDGRLDLHGMTQTEAHAALLDFLGRAQRDEAKVVLIVTGKGSRGRDPANERGVLKRQVPMWLALPEFRALVVGFEDAHLGHGGAGALYVRLRRQR